MTRRVVPGHQSDGAYGLRCSQAGYDASANPVDDSQLTFNSDWITTLPVYLAGAQLGVSNGADLTISFASVGYIPLGFFLSRRSGDSFWVTLPPPYGAAFHPYLRVLTYIDHLRITNGTGASVDIAYTLFLTPGAP